VSLISAVRHAAAVALLASAIPGTIAAQPASGPAKSPTPVPPARFEVRPASSPIAVDGQLDEPAWADAAVIPIAYEWAPGDNTPPPVTTDCLITFDASRLYVGCRALDPDPSAIRAHLMDRDSIDTFIQDDFIGVMIDTFDDERRAYQFRVNALGVQADAVFSDQDGIEDWSWDMIWDSAGRITSDGFVVEIALPFNQLRFRPGDGPHTWGIELFRSWPRTVRHRMSSRWTDRSKNCVLCQENKIEGLSGMRSGRNLEIAPTVTASQTDTREPFPDGGFDADREGDLGATLRWGVTPNLTFSGTINPDFSQVEADVAQLDVNTRFALFYPEKRPFFLEGVDYFATPLEVVFTRTVADPFGGAKLTGKVGRSTVGVFSAADRLNNLLFPSNQGSSSTSLDDEALTTVARVRRDVRARSTLGVIAISREGSDYHNRQVGVDGVFSFTESDTLTWQVLGSSTRYPDRTAAEFGQPSGTFDGAALAAQYQHVSRNWFWFGEYEDLSPEFRSDTGFVPRVDTREAAGGLGRRFWGESGDWYTRLDLALQGSATHDYDGTLTDAVVRPGVSYMGPLQTDVEVGANWQMVRYWDVDYRYWRPVVFVETQPAGWIKAALVTRVGGDVDYDNGRAGRSVMVLPSVELKVGRPFNLQAQHTHQWFDIDAGRLFEAGLTELRAVYHLSLRTFVRAILQYTDVTRDPDLYLVPVPARSRQFFSQYLFSYKVNPQTVVYVGYSDNYRGGQSGGPAGASLDLTQTDRTFFLKVGYAWIP
jgi:hypothetical protein